MRVMWLVAGPNGSGKSTLVRSDFVSRVSREAVFVNPDEIAFGIAEDRGEPLSPDINREAADRAEALVDSLIRDGTSFLVETVLSTDKYIDRVKTARENGFLIGLLFVCSLDPEQTMDRIRQRVHGGGHDVPPEKAVERWGRSVRNLKKFGRLCDIGFIFDNSTFGGPPILVARIDDKGWIRTAGCRIALLDDVIKDLTGS